MCVNKVWVHKPTICAASVLQSSTFSWRCTTYRYLKLAFDLVFRFSSTKTLKTERNHKVTISLWEIFENLWPPWLNSATLQQSRHPCDSTCPPSTSLRDTQVIHQFSECARMQQGSLLLFWLLLLLLIPLISLPSKPSLTYTICMDRNSSPGNTTHSR